MENYRPCANDAHRGALPVGGVGESEEVWGVREQPGCTPTGCTPTGCTPTSSKIK